MKETHPQRYSRQLLLDEVGPEGQQRLAEARVLIVGLGGLGASAALYLAGAGVGTLGLVDHDRVDITNLHRQPLYTEDDLGKSKAEAGAARLRQLHSDIALPSYSRVFDRELADEILASYDVVLDGTDNFETKYLINDSCLLAGIPWVYASVYKYQGQLSVFNYREGPTYRCLFPTPPDTVLSCELTGVLGVVPGTLGLLQAAEVLKMVLGLGEVCSGRVRIIDLLHGRDHSLEVRRNTGEIEKIRRYGVLPVLASCKLQDAPGWYLDVRETYEQPRARGVNLLCIPLGQLEKRHAEIPRKQPVAVFCQSGNRSRQAIRLLRDTYGFDNLSQVEGGIETIRHGEA